MLVLDASAGYRAAAHRQVLLMAQAFSPGDRFNVISASGCGTQFAEAPVVPNESSFMGLENGVVSAKRL